MELFRHGPTHDSHGKPGLKLPLNVLEFGDQSGFRRKGDEGPDFF